MAENSDEKNNGNATDDYPTTSQTSQKSEGNQLSSPRATDYQLPPQSETNQSQALSTSSDVADGGISNPAFEDVPTDPELEQMDKMPEYENTSIYIESEGNQLSSPLATDYQLPPQSETNQSQALSTSSDVADGGTSNPAFEEVPTDSELEQMDKVPRYENTSICIGPLPPPQVDSSTRGQKPQRTSFPSYPSLSEEQARDALLHHVAEHCCFGKKAAQEMVIRSIENTLEFLYTLETFGEKRETAQGFLPYIGQPIDSPINGLSPNPWNIEVSPTVPFKEETIHVEVPHTASIQSCHACDERGTRRCTSCMGYGYESCPYCIVGMIYDTTYGCRICINCGGRGQTRCIICLGEGKIICIACDGKGQLKYFTELTVTWTNHFDDFITRRTSLSDELIRSVSGQLAFEEEAPLIWPVSHCPDEDVNKASSQLVQQHSTNYNTERVLRQRHRIHIVPVSHVNYTWNNKQDAFFVYGLENKVYAPNYPQKSCCGCSIL